MPQGSFSCPCGAIHLLSRFRRDGESSLIPLFVLSHLNPLTLGFKWVPGGFVPMPHRRAHNMRPYEKSRTLRAAGAAFGRLGVIGGVTLYTGLGGNKITDSPPALYYAD